MRKETRRNTKIRKEIPTLDVDEFYALTDLLFEACKENNAHCCRLLGIGSKTWSRWNKEPPTEWWWNIVLRATIKHVLSAMVAKRRMTTRKHQRRILEAMSKIPHSKDYEAEISNLAYEARGAEEHLRLMLLRGGKWWSEIRLPANAEGYSESMLKKAAKSLGVVKRQEGFGKEKDSFWRLPNADDD